MMSNKGTVLVTGATGFIAGHIVYQLLNKGYKVKATARDKDSPKAEFLKTIHPDASSALNIVSADLLSADCWSEIVDGCDYVLHTASPFLMKMSEKELVQTAVSGTENVLNAVIAKKEHIKKVVLTSSVASIMCGHPPERFTQGPFTETDWSVEGSTHGYELSKLRAEKVAWKLVEDHAITMDVICPGFVAGPVLAKHHMSCQSSEYILTMLKNAMWFGVDIRMPITDVRDVADLHIRAMERSECGDRFISASDDGCQGSLMDIPNALNDRLSGKCGWKPPTAAVPNVLARMVALVHPDLKPARQWIGNAAAKVSNKQAKENLNMEFRSSKIAIQEHAISLFQTCDVDPKGYDAEEIKNYTPY